MPSKSKKRRQIQHAKSKDKRFRGFAYSAKARGVTTAKKSKPRNNKSSADLTENPTAAARWTAQGGKCFLCGHPLNLADCSKDHLIPLKRGGARNWSNIVLAHAYCNNHRKHDMPTKEQLARFCNQIGHAPTLQLDKLIEFLASQEESVNPPPAPKPKATNIQALSAWARMTFRDIARKLDLPLPTAHRRHKGP